MKNYFLGLDMGTNSVGWAVTDDKYNILRAKGKDLWGIREFESANTAEERRMHRTARRNRQREVVRRGYLQSYFADAINDVDPNFFARMQNSKYYLEDKAPEARVKDVLFNDKDYHDKDYYEEYPTIYHLRMDLINNPNPHDVRLVYLAIANIFKHRGHFLNQGLGESNGESNMQIAYDRLISMLSSNYNIELPELDADQITDILKDRRYSKTVKSEKLKELIPYHDVENKKFYSEIINAISGRKVKGKNLFPELEGEDNIDFSFAESSFDDNLSEFVSKIGEERYALIEILREIYSIGSLAEIMHGCRYLSESRVKDYDKHHSDLKKLKNVIKKYCDKTVYDEIFRSDDNGTYSAYVNSVNSSTSGKIRRNMKDRKRDDFYSKIKKIVGGMPKEDSDVQDILSDIDRETFMPKMLTSDNGIIPNGVHARELSAILHNAEQYLDFLRAEDENGLSVSDKILQLFKFRIPYYIGPVANYNGKGNGWAVRKANGPVLPWNISEKIDIKATKEKFIERLIRDCTYISGEKVLPKGSMLYERFMVLNEINNIRINDERIPVELKQSIYTDLFERGKRVTKNQLFKYLNNKGLVQDKEQITGLNDQIAGTLTSYGRFYQIFGEKLKEDSIKAQVEEIIKLCTIYGDDKKELANVLRDTYGNLLSDDEIRRICGYKYKDWGRLSRAFLELEGCNKQTGEITTLIQELWNTSYNLMELLHSPDYTFSETLDKQTRSSEKLLSEITPEDLNEFYFSAPVRRMVWQTILLIREITHIMGNEPGKIFIEMTRTDEEKGENGRKQSRKNELTELYKSVKDDLQNWKELIAQEDESGRLRSKKMYLYILQMGRDMYTGEPIDLDNLFNDNIYDIDHIYPRQFVKDNNLQNNMVLVNKQANSRKTNNYPLDASIASNSKVQDLWKTLHEHHLMNDEKYHRLTRRTPFSDEDKAGFIARQMVETGQATKGVADLLKELMPESRIVYSKAGNVSDFRRDYGIVKSRIVNDFHHAHDAYLNIVVGNVYLTKFTDNPLNFVKKEYSRDPEKNHYHLDKMFIWDVKRGNYTAWVKGKEGTISTVKKTLSKNSPILTRMTFEAHGQISEQTLIGKKTAKAGVYLPLKGNDARMTVEKYGGFSSAKGAYYCLVEHGTKAKRIRSIETVPIYKAAEIGDSKDELTKYLGNELGLVNPDVRIAKILMQSLFKRNGYFVYLTGRSGNQLILQNAVNLVLAYDEISYIHKLEKYSLSSIADDLTSEKNVGLYDVLSNKFNGSIFKDRPNPVGKLLISGRDKFLDLNLEEQCYVLIQIFNLSKIGVAKADLKLIGGSSQSGMMKMSKTLKPDDRMELIYQSVSGIFEKRVDLLKV